MLYFSKATGGFYDTDFAAYVLPADAVVITKAVRDAMLVGNAAGQNIVGDAGGIPTLVTPSIPSAQVAAKTLSQKITAGIALTCTGNPMLNATYALDAVSTAQIFQLGLFASQFGVFPGGAVQPYPDATGAPHIFTVAQFIAFLRAVAPLVSVLNTEAQIVAQGGAPSWPSQTATIA